MSIVFVRSEKEAKTWSHHELIDRIEPTGRWVHAWNCPHRNDFGPAQQTPECVDGCDSEVKIVLYEGRVFTTRERNGYDDSDWYAVVWDEAKGELTEYEYATTRFGGSGSAGVDATDEAKVKAGRWLYAYTLDAWRQENERQSHKIEWGREIKVVRGRKVPIGTTGEVVRVDKGQWGQRVNFRDRDGNHFWTAAKNVEIVESARYLKPEWEGKTAARQAVEHQLWYLPFAFGHGMFVV